MVKSFYTDMSIIEWALDFQKQNRRWPKVNDLRTVPGAPAFSLVWHRFGGLSGLREAAELMSGRLSPARVKQLAPRRKQLLQWLDHQICVENRRITPRVLEHDPSMPPMRDFAQCCGGLDAALKALGFAMIRPGDKDLVEAVQKAAEELGRTPRQVDVLAGCCTYTLDVFKARYGCWNLVLKAAKLKLNDVRPTRLKMLEKLSGPQVEPTVGSTTVVVMAPAEAVEASA